MNWWSAGLFRTLFNIVYPQSSGFEFGCQIGKPTTFRGRDGSSFIECLILFKKCHRIKTLSTQKGRFEFALSD